MKRLIYIILFLLTAVACFAAGPVDEDGAPISTAKKQVIGRSYAWRLNGPLGLRDSVDMDTLPLNYYRQSIPALQSDCWVTTGNLGDEGINMIFHDRLGRSDFLFDDALREWHPTFRTMRFYNTRIPMTLVSFNTAGGKETSTDRLKAVFSGNINAKAQVGALIDFIYSKGCYANQATKDLSWGLNGSYLGDRYEMQAYYNHWNLLNKENGGITDMRYITNPAEMQGGVGSIESTAIPTKLTKAHTRVLGSDLFVNNRYKFGFWRDLPMEEGDTVAKREYVPVTSVIYTLQYKDGSHLFLDNNGAELMEYYGRAYLNPKSTYDRTSYWQINNTVGVSLLEGFNRYAKFGLSAYLTHQVERYTFPTDTVDHSSSSLTPLPEGFTPFGHSYTRQRAWVGAQLTKQRGSLLRYDVSGELGILGDAAGDVKIDGSVSTKFPLWGDSLAITAEGRFHNVEAPLLMQRYISNQFAWRNNFGKERTLTLGGHIDLGKSDTHVRAFVTNLQNFLYFNSEGLPSQNAGSIQVLSVSLRQNIHAGIWHWDNTVTYQTSTNEKVLSLPKLTVYSNMYLQFRIATLWAQLGVDCDYYTRYYAPNYQPATANFCSQHEIMVGNYPMCSAYLNMKLSRARFYVMYSHFNEGLFGGDNYFSAPYYPINPARFQMGVSVDFAN